MTEDSSQDEIPRQSLYELLPRRSLWKAVLLLFVLAGVVYLKSNTAAFVKQVDQIVGPAGPRVRLAAPPGAAAHAP